MGNKALKELRRTLEDMPCGGDLIELLDKAIEHEAGRPERQMAKSQARLVKAKADILELQLAQQRGDLVKAAQETKPLEVCIGGLRFFVNKPSEATIDSLGNATMTATIGVDVQEPKPLTAKDEEEALQAALRCGFVKPGSELHQDMYYRIVERTRSERLKRTIAQQEAQRIRDAEERGFRRAKHVALEALERRWGKFRRYSRPYDEAMAAAVDEIKGIALPKVEG